MPQWIKRTSGTALVHSIAATCIVRSNTGIKQTSRRGLVDQGVRWQLIHFSQQLCQRFASGGEDRLALLG
jgi:hypothetical protein